MKNHLCDYKIIKETDDGVYEICRECKKKLKTPKGKDGRIDNKKYLKEHRKDFLQPTGSTAKEFKKHYGEANYEHKK